MSVLARPTASVALDALVQQLADAGITASRDPGAFYLAPLGVLVGLPTLTGWTLSARRYTVPVYVVSSDPLVSPAEVDALYALADDVAFALACDSYLPTDWRGSVNAEPLPAVQLQATVTVAVSEPATEPEER